MPDEDEGFEVVPDDQRAGALHIIDDGCDWTAWLVWNMNSRRRLSEHRFALPPERKQITPLATRKKKIRRRSKLSFFTMAEE